MFVFVQNVCLQFLFYFAVPEVDEYPLMSSPAPILVGTAIYLFVVLKLGPAYMEKRKPYDLRKFLIFYNLFQICACYWAAARVSSNKLKKKNNNKVDLIFFTVYRIGILVSEYVAMYSKSARSK